MPSLRTLLEERLLEEPFKTHRVLKERYDRIPAKLEKISDKFEVNFVLFSIPLSFILILLLIIFTKGFTISGFFTALFIGIYVGVALPIPTFIVWEIVKVIIKATTQKSRITKLYKASEKSIQPDQNEIQEVAKQYLDSTIQAHLNVRSRDRAPEEREEMVLSIVDDLAFLEENRSDLGINTVLSSEVNRLKAILKGLYSISNSTVSLTKHTNAPTPITGLDSPQHNTPKEITVSKGRTNSSTRKPPSTLPSPDPKTLDEENSTAGKVNWLQKQANREAIGAIGEQIVLELERSKLAELDLIELIPQIKLISQTEGDGAGYDILSFDRFRQKIYIEVKTSVVENADFYMSKNELNTMDKFSDRYWLYRISNLDVKTGEFRLDIYRGKRHILGTFSPVPEKWKAVRKKQFPDRSHFSPTNGQET